MYSLQELQSYYNKYISSLDWEDSPQSLYKPIQYILEIGGKRIRPALALAACQMYGEDIADAIPVANAVEFFHNFSLMHDDIMDNSFLRRGKETVHIKYDTNTAILSGDVLLIKAYQCFDNYDTGLFSKMTKHFTQMATLVCEGQRDDMDFEVREKVEIEDYIQMITNKTAVLLGTSLYLGASLTSASESDLSALYNFGKNIGVAFQIQDDIIDVFGDQSLTGKKKGGDILQKKKTYLYLKSLELLSDSEVVKLENVYKQDDLADDELIAQVTQLFESCHVKVYAEELRDNYKSLALAHLNELKVEDKAKTTLMTLSEFLTKRTH